MKSKKQIEQAIHNINDNSELLYGYREDVISVLRWVLNQGEIDGLEESDLKAEDKK